MVHSVYLTLEWGRNLRLFIILCWRKQVDTFPGFKSQWFLGLFVEYVIHIVYKLFVLFAGTITSYGIDAQDSWMARNAEE